MFSRSPAMTPKIFREMTGKMGVKTFLVILLMHAYMDEVHPAKVPSKFIGYWKGRVNTAETSYTIIAAITGGSTNSIVWLLHVLEDGDLFCPHKIKLTTEDGKARVKSVEDSFESRTKEMLYYAGFCRYGKFNFEALSKDRTVMDWIWLDEDGEATNELSTILERFDDGQLTKKLNKCEPKNSLTPAGKLKKELDEDKKKQKRG